MLSFVQTIFFVVWLIVVVCRIGPPLIARFRRMLPWRKISIGLFHIRADQVRAIAEIDTVPLVRRLARKHQMDVAAAEIAVAEYQAFLAIAAANPGRTVAPTSDPCDEAWHAHILHTQAYDRDMRKIFGRPFHHRPAGHAGELWLEEPRERTARTLDRLYHLSSWSGLSNARAARNIPDDVELSNAAIFGMVVAAGPDRVEALATLHPALRDSIDKPERPDGFDDGIDLPLLVIDTSSGSDSDQGASCGGSASDSPSCGGGSSCSGSSCSSN